MLLSSLRCFMSLIKYQKKRDFSVTPEPKAKIKDKKRGKHSFVIQEHHARHLHYDLRLEVNGVLKSWAIPKKPSLSPSVKRLAIRVEDHPYEYKDFEGTISEGYGAGTVEIWDAGTYSVGKGEEEIEKLMKKGLKEGKIEFSLKGKRLNGTFVLIRLKNTEKEEWLFFKKKGESSSEDLPLSNLNKIFWPKEKITKGDLIEYYKKIAPWMLPYLKDRPESLRRFPDGINGICFFQKNVKNHPDFLETQIIQHESKKVEYALIQDERSLLFLVNLGCIEIHPFFSRTQTLQNPDFIVFDLDPKDAPFSDVIQIAQKLHRLLDSLKISSYCKTSGRRGLHVAIALGAKYSYEEAASFAELIALKLHEQTSDISTLERSIAKRKGKVYIDFHQNNFGQTIVAPYSVRAYPGASVSAPLKWSEVRKGLDPQKFTLKTMLRRVKKMGDLYLPILGKGIDLKKALKKFKKLF